jgi:pimeloyl-ACP methyl ester carboxylesterase
MGRTDTKHGAEVRILPCLITAAFSVTALAASAAESKAFPSHRDFAGLVSIGGGRRLYMQCRGVGAPTVVLISGKGNGAADWGQVLDPADPAHGAADDAVGAGQGRLRDDGRAVFPAVSRFTRVCAYDRPGTRIDGPDISTPVAQPQPVDQAVRDLAAALSSAGETGPYILVAHSYGGLVAALYARTHPGEVAGLVMVDAATERMKEVVSPGKLANWDAINRASTPAAPEAVELADAIDKIDAAPPGPKVPAIVLSADKPWRSSPADAGPGVAGGEMVTFADWLAAQDLLAASLQARHVKQTRSGHHVYLYEPQLVVGAIREVADEARRVRP